MKLEAFTKKLRAIYEDELESIILFGSAAGEDFHKRYSNFNTMIVLKDISLISLAKSAKLCRKWMGQSNPAPLFVDEEHIETSHDVFPIEFMDMKEQHIVLFGKDPFPAMKVHNHHLRHACESELKGKIIALRTAWIQNGNSKAKIRQLMLKSSSSFFAIFRGILRLVGEQAPAKKKDVLYKLNEKTHFDTSAFDKILEVLEGRRKLARVEIFPLMEEYLTTLERVATFVDEL